VVIAAVAAAAIGQTVSDGDGTEPPRKLSAQTTLGHYVAYSAAAALDSRDATRISRSATRPAALPEKKKDASKPERRALARYTMLRQAANDAEKYAKRLSSTNWSMPTADFRISAPFGVAGPYWASGYHTGTDFAAAYGTPVVAVDNGTVVKTGWDGPYGNQVRLKLPNGDQVWYNHLSAIEVTVGRPVLKGQELGRVGDTGNAFGYHLHLEYRPAAGPSAPVDPMPYLRDHGLSFR
jgi:murein DD-endopeptidase MepM/ murein hydrolase activator NlpD